MLTLQDVHFSIEDKKILDGVSVHFEPCRIHGIIGPNGSGKSTMLKNICRIWEPQSGTISLQGRDCRTIPRRELSALVTLVPQNTVVSFPVPVFDIVSMGRNPHRGRFEGMTRRDREIIEQALRQTGTYELRGRNVNELSGGEAQLAIIARALATEASLILLDEPTAELDIRHTLAIMTILFELKAQCKTILVTVHDLNLAIKFCDTITIIHRGRVFYAGAPQEAFSTENIKQVFDVQVRELKDSAGTFLDFYA